MKHDKKALKINENFFDIFETDWLDQNHLDKTDIKFLIYKNDKYISTIKTRYSWDHIQIDFGGGSYKVVCKTIRTNKYLIRQSMIVADIEYVLSLQMRKRPIIQKNKQHEALDLLRRWLMKDF